MWGNRRNFSTEGSYNGYELPICQVNKGGTVWVGSFGETRSL